MEICGVLGGQGTAAALSLQAQLLWTTAGTHIRVGVHCVKRVWMCEQECVRTYLQQCTCL